MDKTVKQEERKTALAKALENPKGADRPTVYKGFYIYADQHIKMIELSAHNKIKGVEPATASDMIREALDLYLAKK
jgi:hypothetical protein